MNNVSPTQYLPGFKDPVFDCQQTFRILLKALSRPGTIQPLTGAPQAPEPMYPTTAALALTLFDLHTPVWLDSSLGNPEVRRFLGFHCGVPIMGQPGQASFGIFGNGQTFNGLEGLNQGDPAYPDRSATVIIQVEGFSGPKAVSLTGPGVKGRIRLSVEGLADAFWMDFKENHQRFPLGVDCYLVSPEAVCGLPRTAGVEV